MERAKIVALCSRDAEEAGRRLDEHSGQFRAARHADGPLRGALLSGISRRLLADPAVDLVDLCVPNDAHGRMAIEALQAGKHVLVEKPIALSTGEADAMVAAARSAGKLLMVGSRVAVLSRVCFCPRGRSIWPVRCTSGCPFDARHLEARLVQRNRRSES